MQHEQEDYWTLDQHKVFAPQLSFLRCFEVQDIEATLLFLQQKNIIAEPVRVDAYTNKRFTFIADPDNLPIEFYEG